MSCSLVPGVWKVLAFATLEPATRYPTRIHRALSLQKLGPHCESISTRVYAISPKLSSNWTAVQRPISVGTAWPTINEKRRKNVWAVCKLALLSVQLHDSWRYRFQAFRMYRSARFLQISLLGFFALHCHLQVNAMTVPSAIVFDTFFVEVQSWESTRHKRGLPFPSKWHRSVDQLIGELSTNPCVDRLTI